MVAWNVKGVAHNDIKLTKTLSQINFAAITETRKKLKGSKRIENYIMLNSRVKKKEGK